MISDYTTREDLEARIAVVDAKYCALPADDKEGRARLALLLSDLEDALEFID